MEPTHPASHHRRRLHSRMILRLLAFAYLGIGMALGFLAQPKAVPFLETILGVLTMVGIYVWCRVESLERGTLPPGRSPLWAAVFPPILLPVYFFRTRRARTAFAASAKALALYVGLWFAFLVGVLGVGLVRG
jgi:hypothetical protein